MRRRVTSTTVVRTEIKCIILVYLWKNEGVVAELEAVGSCQSTWRVLICHIYPTGLLDRVSSYCRGCFSSNSPVPALTIFPTTRQAEGDSSLSCNPERGGGKTAWTNKTNNCPRDDLGQATKAFHCRWRNCSDYHHEWLILLNHLTLISTRLRSLESPKELNAPFLLRELNKCCINAHIITINTIANVPRGDGFSFVSRNFPKFSNSGNGVQ